MRSIEKQIKPLRFSIYYWTIFIVSLIGFLDSIYLSSSHYRVYVDIGYKSFCALSKSFNCDTVSQSPYSILFGIPVPIWGVVGYGFFIIFLVWANTKRAEKKRLWSILFFISVCYSVYSLVLAIISTFFIHTYCIMCILSYGVNLCLLLLIYIIRDRFSSENFFTGLYNDIQFLMDQKLKSALIFLSVLSIIIALFFSMPAYWKFEPPGIAPTTLTGITKDGHPWIGAENPELIITEFTDYLCFQCKKMHFFLRELINKHPDKIRLIHRNFPMDHEFNPGLVTTPFHVGAGKMAMLGVYALTKEKFWATNDYLYSLSADKPNTIELKKLSVALGFNLNELVHAAYYKPFRLKVKHDIAVGLKNKITGTPSYIIDNKMYSGIIPPEILKKIMD